MSSSAGLLAGARESVDTLVIGGGQAGLATSYWLTHAGVEHLVVERRNRFGGGWLDRWDSFCLVAPNFVIRLPGMPYAGPDPEGFMARDEVVNYLQDYAASFAAPVRLGTTVNRLAASNGHFEAHTDGATLLARNVVLATGPYQQPKVPAASGLLPGHIQQLHSHHYRRPPQLADGAVLVVGTGQSGTQIAEELHQAGREVHLAVSMCPNAPRRYRGRDFIWWLLQWFLHGAEVGVPFPTVEDLPSPAARFGCDPHVSGKDGGHDINLRQFARHGIHLYGRLESATGATVQFSDDLDERLAFADRGFDEEFRPMFDAYIAAAGIDAPPDERPPYDDFTPTTTTELDLDAAGSVQSCGRRVTSSTSAGWTCLCWTSGDTRDTSGGSPPTLGCTPSGCAGCTPSHPRCSLGSAPMPRTSSSTSRASLGEGSTPLSGSRELA